MDKFPVEILREIFNLSLFRGRGCEEGEFSPYFTVPLIISHVSRHWRQVAIAFGNLWTRLEIQSNCPRIKYDMVHTWIARTNGLPLDFEIEYRLEDDDDIEQRRTLESVTKLLLAEQYRWRDVYFDWRFRAFSPEFTRIDITHMPMLVYLSLGINIRKTNDGKRILPNVSLARSRLVETITLEFGYAVEYGTEPLQHLENKTFYLRDEHWREARAAKVCLDALWACPNLQTFVVHYKYTNYCLNLEREMLENRPHLIHDIENLVLDDADEGFPELLISRVTLPNLRELEFKTSIEVEMESALPEFFQRSNPPLERLELYGKCLQHRNLFPSLRHLPSLKTLVIELCHDPVVIFEGLSSIVDGRIICPNLRRLHIKEYEISLFVPDPRRALDACCAMVELRETPASPGRVRVNNDFVIPSSHLRREFEMLLELLSDQSYGPSDLHVTFESPEYCNQ